MECMKKKKIFKFKGIFILTNKIKKSFGDNSKLDMLLYYCG